MAIIQISLNSGTRKQLEIFKTPINVVAGGTGDEGHNARAGAGGPGPVISNSPSKNIFQSEMSSL